MPVQHTDHHNGPGNFSGRLINIDRNCDSQDYHTIYLIKIGIVRLFSLKCLLQYIIHFIGQTCSIGIGIILRQWPGCFVITDDPHVNFIGSLQFINISSIFGKAVHFFFAGQFPHSFCNYLPLPAESLCIRTHIIIFI